MYIYIYIIIPTRGMLFSYHIGKSIEECNKKSRISKWCFKRESNKSSDEDIIALLSDLDGDAV